LSNSTCKISEILVSLKKSTSNNNTNSHLQKCCFRPRGIWEPPVENQCSKDCKSQGGSHGFSRNSLVESMVTKVRTVQPIIS